MDSGLLEQITFIEKMLKLTLQLLVTIKLLFTLQINAQPGTKVGMCASAIQFSTEVFHPFLGYEVSWVQDGKSNPAIELKPGIFYAVKLSNIFNLQLEHFFIEKGYKYDRTPLYNTNYSLNINCLRLLVLFEYNILLDWRFNPIITTRPFFALKISSDETISIENEEVSSEVSSVNGVSYIK